MPMLYRFHGPELSRMDVRYYLQDGASVSQAGSFPPHVHDRYEFYVLIEGDASFMVENRLYALRVGDVVFSRPNEIHNCVLNSNSIHKHFCIWFDAPDDLLLRGTLAEGGREQSHISPAPEARERILQICHALCEAAEEGRRLRQLSLALELLDLLQGNPTTAQEAHAGMPEVLSKILDDINRNYDKISDLSYFTERYYLSFSTLNRMFQRYLQTSPRLYLETKRLAVARTLLRQGRSVTEAGARAGFSNGSNFIRLFKKRFHMTPTEYKNGTEVKDTDAVIL